MNITQNKFKNNIGVKEGGAIYYNYNRPVLSRNAFTNNQASYGPNIASYPVKIAIRNSSINFMSLTNVGSGVKYENDIALALLDYDDQEMVLNSQDLININPFSFSHSSILGINYGQLENGVAVFNDLTFISNPGDTDVKFSVTSSAIDIDKMQNVFGSQISDNQIDVSFRWCKPGEIYDQVNKCIP